ncbi:MAG: glycerophosphodiester phosphodiesterase [Gallionella sp.]|jgi:glycerophosphoryl diester phosphodiesterase|nr:glycerophosphodiester phosphodiesterase [Gallionella sp.]
MNHCYQSLIYAHRGANREAAENTRTAFDRALSYPIDGIETDIQLTRDGVAVL